MEADRAEFLLLLIGLLTWTIVTTFAHYHDLLVLGHASVIRSGCSQRLKSFLLLGKAFPCSYKCEGKATKLIVLALNICDTRYFKRGASPEIRLYYPTGIRPPRLKNNSTPVSSQSRFFVLPGHLSPTFLRSMIYLVTTHYTTM